MAAAFTAPDSDLVNTIHPTGNCTWGALTPKWGVLHTMETPETTQIAENIAGWFANPAAGTSAHYCIDPDSIVQCVDERAAAWAAMPTGNAFGIHLELAGRAAQTATEWADPASQSILDRAAALMADICTRHGIPVRFLTDQQLANGEKGITTHAQISRVFRESDHTDPGDGFPAAQFLALTQKHYTGGVIAETVSTLIENGDEMTNEQTERLLTAVEGIHALLRPGKEQHWHAGPLYNAITNTSIQTQQTKDALTRGQDGIKWDGDIFSQNKQLIATQQETNRLLVELIKNQKGN